MWKARIVCKQCFAHYEHVGRVIKKLARLRRCPSCGTPYNPQSQKPFVLIVMRRVPVRQLTKPSTWFKRDQWQSLVDGEIRDWEVIKELVK